MAAIWLDAGDVSSKGREMFRQVYKTEGLVLHFQGVKKKKSAVRESTCL